KEYSDYRCPVVFSADFFKTGNLRYGSGREGNIFLGPDNAPFIDKKGTARIFCFFLGRGTADFLVDRNGGIGGNGPKTWNTLNEFFIFHGLIPRCPHLIFLEFGRAFFWNLIPRMLASR